MSRDTFLDGWTSNKAMHITRGHLLAPSTAYDSYDSSHCLRQLRQPTTAYDSLRQLTHVITATTATTAYDSLRQPSDNDSYDSIRQMYDSLRQLRQLRQPGLNRVRM